MASAPAEPASFLDRSREVWADAFRFVATAVWLPWVLVKRPEAVALWAPMMVIPFVALAAVAAARYDWLPRYRRGLISVLDVFLLGYVAWALGSVTSPVIIFFVVTVTATTMASSIRAGLMVTVAVIVIYGAVLLLETWGVLPVAPLARHGLKAHETSGGRPFAFISVALSCAAAFGFLGYARRRLEGSAERERTLRLAEQAAQQRALELQRQLELAQRMESLGRLAGGVAHDFNNLLTVIHGSFAFGLQEAAGEGGDLRDALEDGRAAARRAAALVQQLLAFSRRQPVRPQVLAPAELVGRTRRMLEWLLGAGITLEIDLAPGLGNVSIDPTQLEQALINLVVNSRDAMPGGGRIRIAGRDRVLTAVECALRPGTLAGAFVELSVEDEGCGMDEETLRRAFEPFFTTKPLGRGTGLGLPTTFGIVQQNKGWLELSSRVGQGTVARMLLPRTDAAAAPLETEEPPSQSGHETVLLVEDEDSLRRMASRALETRGYRVLEAASGEEALEAARYHRGTIEVLVTDLVMPGMTGKALAETVRKDRPAIRVLFMSGYSPEALDQEALLSDGASFLAKPFEPDQFAARVRRLLDEKSQAIPA